jgi:hypothetical protein
VENACGVLPVIPPTPRACTVGLVFFPLLASFWVYSAALCFLETGCSIETDSPTSPTLSRAPVLPKGWSLSMLGDRQDKGYRQGSHRASENLTKF